MGKNSSELLKSPKKVIKPVQGMGNLPIVPTMFRAESISMTDDAFFQFSAHVDKATCEKIAKGEFVELGKLLIKDKLEDDNRMEIVNKDGRSYFVLASEKDIPTINSYLKWEKAFDVYMGIYTTYIHIGMQKWSNISTTSNQFLFCPIGRILPAMTGFLED